MWRRQRRRTVEDPRESLDEDVVVGGVSNGDPNRVGRRADDEAAAQQGVADGEAVLERHVEEVPASPLLYALHPLPFDILDER
jgi:hypothetical protein